MNHKMMMMRKRLACCSRDRELSIDFDDQEKVITYNGLESYILDSHPYNDENLTSAVDGCLTDSYDDDSSCSSSNNVSASFSSNCTTKRGDDGTDEWESPLKPRHFYVKEKPSHTTELEDLETMKERFSKLLLGDDITGGSKGTSTALALSNAISNLAASVFGELWKLEPLPEERKKRWRREMDWFLSPTIYMIELVPARQNGSNGHIVEIMTPKARSDIHMNLPALRKLDSMLIETLDSMTNTEFWYAEVGSSRAEGRSKSAGQSRRWWLPSPRVPIDGLSDTERQKILNQGRIVSQIFKAAKSINENVLLEMPVPDFVRDALPKSGKESLGEELYKILTAETATAGDTINMLNLKSENKALEASNKLEAAIFTWKEIIAEQADGGSPVRKSWSFLKDPITEMDRTEYLLNRSEVLLQQLKSKYPNLPQTFLDAMKVQYGKDVGHSIIEAYSRVVGNLAFSILSRIGDILQEDIISNPNSPIAVCTNPWISESPMLDRIRLSLIDKINKVDGNSSSRKDDSDMKSQSMERRLCSMNAMPNHSQGFL